MTTNAVSHRSQNANECPPPDRLVPLFKRVRDVSVDDVYHFMNNLQHEKIAAGYGPEHVQRMFSMSKGAGRLWAEDYYKQTICRPLQRATRAIFERFASPRIMDVACGNGTQAILFALFGAEVFGFDIDAGQIDSLRERVSYYSRVAGRELPVEAQVANVLETDARQFGTFDVVFSWGGLGRILSADKNFETFGPALKPGGLLILHNANPHCLWYDLARVPVSGRDKSSLSEYRAAAAKHGFRILAGDGTTALPQQFWKAKALATWPDGFLRNVGKLQMHYDIIAERI